MFQSFDVPTRPDQGPPRLRLLRDAMAAEELDGYLVPRADAHQGEYVAPCDDRLTWLTGFTGSAGFCTVLTKKAGIFIDGRYRVQVKSQVDLSHFTPVHWPEIKLGDWLKAELPDGGTVGFDPWLHTANEIEQLRDALDQTNITLRDIPNLVDRIWQDRPAPPNGKIIDHPIKYAGISSVQKRTDCAVALRTQNQRSAVLTLPDSICWLLNIRGNDIARNPIVQAFAIIHDTGKVALFTDPAKASGLPSDPDITIQPFDHFAVELAALTGPVRVDKKSAPLAVSLILEKAGTAIDYAVDLCALPKARKNPVEIAGAREAHQRDGAALAEFLAWLDATALRGNLSEIDVVRQLEGFRHATNALKEISFDTISGTGPNGAIVHYRVTEDSNRMIAPGDLLLVDSGGQYLDGTTDITRTIAVGTPSLLQRACFTRVLQGMIAISRARWPKGLTGRDLDPLARAALWMAGLDYDHGTGHGVGSYLCVHEGPQRISRLSDVPLETGMILSNEPGYYREGAFGIRIENLVVCQAAPELEGADDRDMLSFETLTYVPVDRRLILLDILSAAEREWLNAYHAVTLSLIGPRVSKATLNWLTTACAPL